SIGIGCRKGVTKEAIRDAVDDFLAVNKISPLSIKGFASIDLKKDEEGLLAYCRENGYEIKFYSADELATIEGCCSASEFVLGVTGVDNVCERAALTGADRLIESKTVYSGITLAAAIKDTEVSFE
ncbi:MAG: cobalamin biosynthesis protein, partial [Firmicutes bacterium]|nr:cobalamin biosynthesis protein [Bacillota bacterium]